MASSQKKTTFAHLVRIVLFAQIHISLDTYHIKHKEQSKKQIG